MNLKRILEPEVMDSEDEAYQYDRMDHDQVNQIFIEDFLAAHQVAGDILDMGTGTARIPILLCQAIEDCRVMAIDMSVSMLDLARFNIEAEGQSHRITLQLLDAKSLPVDDGMFQFVISNSIIHHIPEPIECLTESVRVLAPGGGIFFRDLLRPEDDATVRQLVENYTGNENEHQQKLFDDSLRAALSMAEIRQMVVDLGFSADGVSATSDRHWTWSAVKPDPS